MDILKRLKSLRGTSQVTSEDIIATEKEIERLREYYEAAEDVMDELEVGYGDGFDRRLKRLNDAQAALEGGTDEK